MLACYDRTFDFKISNDVEGRLSVAIPSLESSIEDQQIALFQFPQSRLGLSGVAVGVGLKLRVIVQTKIVCFSPSPLWKITDEQLAVNRAASISVSLKVDSESVSFI